MWVKYENQAYKHYCYMFFLLFCIIQIISSNEITETKNLLNNVNNQIDLNKTQLESNNKINIISSYSPQEINALNSTSLKEKEKNSTQENENQKLFEDYSVYEKSSWEFLILNFASCKKDNSTLISELDLDVYHEKNKIELALTFPELKLKINSSEAIDKENLLRSLSVFYKDSDFTEEGKDKTIFLEKLVTKYLKNTVSKINTKYNEDTRISKEKPLLLIFRIKFFMDSVLISSDNRLKIYMENSENHTNNSNSDINNLISLKNVFKSKKKSYLTKEDFLKSASNDIISNSIHNDNNTNSYKNINNIHYFKFKESLSKSKRILDSIPNLNQKQNINLNLKENLDLEYQIQNPYLPSSTKQNNKLRLLKNSVSNLQQISKNNFNNKKEIPNPCFLKGYFSNKTKIKGSGNYAECFKQFNESIGNKFAEMEDLSQNKTSVLLGSDFKDIADIIASENTTIQNFNLLAEQICATEYKAIKEKYFFIANVDNICFKMCYASVIFSKLFKNNYKIILIFSTNIKNISPEAENEIIMSNYFSFQAESIPPWIIVLFVFLILSFFFNYFFKDEMISLLKRELYKNELICLCLKSIRKIMLSAKEEKDAELGFRGGSSNANANKTIINKNNSRALNASQNNNVGREETERECIANIIDLVRQQDDEFKEFFENKLYLKDNSTNNLNPNYNNHHNYHNNHNNQLTLVGEYQAKTKENNKQNSFYNNNNHYKNQSLSEEDLFYQKFNSELNLANSEEKKDILDTLINSLPVKNFLYTVLLKKIKDLCEREIFLSFSEFKVFFYGEVENEIQLKLVILETIEKRNHLKATKVFCLVQMLLAISLSILTNKIFSFISFNNSYIQGVIIVLFSFLYMTLLIMECLILITIFDYEKYYYSNILTQSEKLFLEQEFSVEPNHNNELF